jgi:hypothetical protein
LQPNYTLEKIFLSELCIKVKKRVLKTTAKELASYVNEIEEKDSFKNPTNFRDFNQIRCIKSDAEIRPLTLVSLFTQNILYLKFDLVKHSLSLNTVPYSTSKWSYPVLNDGASLSKAPP